MEALMVIGEPGVGKSTFVSHLTRGLPYEETTSPFAFRRYDAGVYELGARRKEYSGTDALPLNVQPVVTEFLTVLKPEFVLAEGDRLANRKFFTALRQMGYNLTVVCIYGEDVARRQRALRGSSQDESWLKGRQTKVRRLMDDDDVLTIKAGGALDFMFRQIAESPVVARLEAARVGAFDAVL